MQTYGLYYWRGRYIGAISTEIEWGDLANLAKSWRSCPEAGTSTWNAGPGATLLDYCYGSEYFALSEIE